ncbi:hypothetical protein HF281_05875 [Acidithiobacillus caldus]|nr:hypothetical protein [Acidithiobacillus caldus]
MQAYDGAAGAAAFWVLYWTMGDGYGLATMLRAARGAVGKDTSSNWEAQRLAREYFLRCIAFPRWATLLMLPLVIGLLACFVGTLATGNPKGGFVDGEMACVALLALISLLPLRKPRKETLGVLFAGDGGRRMRKMIQEMPMSQPMRWIDVTSLRPSWIGLGFFVSALIGGLLINFASMWRELSVPTTIPLWILTSANLFAIPIFIGFSMIGLFPWPAGTVRDEDYYPLLVLKRAAKTI